MRPGSVSVCAKGPSAIELANDPEVRARIKNLLEENPPLSVAESQGVRELCSTIDRKVAEGKITREETPQEEIARLEKEVDLFTRLKILRAAKAELLQQLAMAASPNAYPKLETIALHLLKYTGYKMNDLKGPLRTAPICRIRNAYFREARKAGFTLDAIGRFVNRDHTSVAHGLRVIDETI
jgi:chromosomal replication initiation ATPase DnaA